MSNLRTIKNTRRKNHTKKVIAETIIVSTLILSMLPLSVQAASKTLENFSFEESFIGQLLLVNDNDLNYNEILNKNVTLWRE